MLKDELKNKENEKLSEFVVNYGFDFKNLNLTNDELKTIRELKEKLKLKQEELLDDTFVSESNNIGSIRRQLRLDNSDIEKYINLIKIGEIDIENELIGKNDEFPKRVLFLVRNIKLINKDLEELNKIIK